MKTQPDSAIGTKGKSGGPAARQGHAATTAKSTALSRDLFRPGSNCWRVADATRVAVLVDGEEYYAAVRQSMIRAQRQILIAGWDLHSQLQLVRGPVDDESPRKLVELLTSLLQSNSKLDVFILLWDYASIYALEREPLFLGDNPWEGHPRLHFVKDNQHPLTASQHQKLVVIDGSVAYCGGFDLSTWRWDTNAHPAQEPRRIDTDGAAYQPFHDIQMLVDGDAAVALRDLFLDRWRWATGTAVATLPDSKPSGDAWPEGVKVMLREQQVAVARTFSAFNERPEVREIEKLYLDTIARAQHLIYLENQYLTSRSIGDALCASLARERGPEVIIILPQRTGAWIEQHTMDILRARILSKLRESDRHGRLRVYYPAVVGLSDGCLMVHAKLTIADDRLLRIGSSNLSNRSMGLDSECDLCLVGEGDHEVTAIRGLRHRLLGIFLSVDAEEVARAEASAYERGQGIICALEELQTKRANASDPPQVRIADLDGEVDPEWDRQLPDERIVDPDGPIDADLVTDVVVGGEEHLPHVRWRLSLGLGLIVLFVALAAAWRWTPLGDWLNPSAIAAGVNAMSDTLWGPPIAVAGFIAAAMIAVPVTLLILVAAIVFGPFLGALVALVGSIASAFLGYGIGRYLGRPTVERMAGSKLERLSKRMASYGILTVVAVRVVPVAPFAVINLFSGASHLRLRDFMIGTAIGMAPAILAMSIFAEGLLSVISKADLRSVALVVVGGLAVAGLAWYGKRKLAVDE